MDNSFNHCYPLVNQLKDLKVNKPFSVISFGIIMKSWTGNSLNENYVDWTKEDLIREIEKLKKRKKYGIVWEEKPETVAELCKEKLPILKEIKNREIKTDENEPINILIEGDNYHALSVLNYTHKEAVDVIYIDPPYNQGTGDKFVYNNKIVDEEDSYRHSKWLSFMEKRLKLAKNLLSKTGIIFISINDTEQSQLKLLCDEIFEENNFIGMLIWKNKAGGGGKQSPNIPTKEILKKEAFVVDNEYILVYSKNINNIKRFEEPLSEKDIKSYKNPDNDPNGPYKLKDLEQSIPTPIRTMYYSIKDPDGVIIKPKGGKYQWRFSEERAKKEFRERRIIWKKIKCSKDRDKREYYYRPMVKQYLHTFGKMRTKIMRSILWDVAYTKDGANELKEILGVKDDGTVLFNYPKPLNLIKTILRNLGRSDGVFLDFFAGSGTTGHAILELNKEDKGKRKFILCTNNENNICTHVCYPRIERVIKGYKNFEEKSVNGPGGNLKYFKTTFVEGEPTDKNKKNLVDQSTEMLCLKEYCFNEVESGSYFKIFKNNDEKHLGIVYDDAGIEPLKNEVKKINKQINIYVFSLDSSAREEEFEDIIDLVNLKPIPEVILNVYRRIFA